MTPPPIKIPVEIKIQELWEEAVFQRNTWRPINFLVGATAVPATYAMPASAEPLAFLVELNLALAAREKGGETTTPPGLPVDVATFITIDSVRARQPESFQHG